MRKTSMIAFSLAMSYTMAADAAPKGNFTSFPPDVQSRVLAKIHNIPRETLDVAYAQALRGSALLSLTVDAVSTAGILK